MSKAGLCVTAGFLIVLTAASAEAGLGLGARYSYVRNHGLEDNSGMLGAMVRLKSTFIAFEGAIDRRNEELNDGAELETTPLTASVMLFPLPMIYGVAGLGYYRTTITPPNGAAYGSDTDTQLGYHYGAGLELPLVPMLKLTGDVRYQFIDYEFDDIASSIGKVDADALAVSAGLIVYLK